MKEYIKAVKDFAWQSTSFVWFYDRRTKKINNGTIFFVKLKNNEIYAITANHLYCKYIERCEKENNIVCNIGNYEINLADHIHDRNTDLDIAIFKLDITILNELSCTYITFDKTSLKNASHYPVIFCGFPAEFRKIEEAATAKSVLFGGYDALTFFKKLDENGGSIEINWDYTIKDDGKEMPKPHTPMGGLSGSPIYLIDRSKKIETLKPIGLITDQAPWNADVYYASLLQSLNDTTGKFNFA